MDNRKALLERLQELRVSKIQQSDEGVHVPKDKPREAEAPTMARTRKPTGLGGLLRRAYARHVPSEIACFPDIEVDLREVLPLLKGKVLNAGAGTREVAHSYRRRARQPRHHRGWR